MNLPTPYLFILIFFGCLLFIGILLSFLSKKENVSDNIEKRIEDALPGVQCAQCGYPGCHAYACALAKGEAKINQCIPGGPDTVDNLAKILNVDAQQLKDDSDDMIFTPRTVAIIHKQPCTGCTKCTRVCPVDAIKGKIRMVHEVDMEECIGCGECVDICPVKCIEMTRLEPTIKNFNWEIESIRITGETK